MDSRIHAKELHFLFNFIGSFKKKCLLSMKQTRSVAITLQPRNPKALEITSARGNMKLLSL